MRDQKQIIREASAETLSACLKIVYERESSMRIQWYTKIYEEASRNLKTGNADQIHGALLAYRELLHHAKSVRYFSKLILPLQLIKFIDFFSANFNY